MSTHKTRSVMTERGARAEAKRLNDTNADLAYVYIAVRSSGNVWRAVRWKRDSVTIIDIAE